MSQAMPGPGSRPPMSHGWARALGLGWCAFAAYALLPEIAPAADRGHEQVLVLGILLGLVVGTGRPASTPGSCRPWRSAAVPGSPCTSSATACPWLVAVLLGLVVAAEVLVLCLLLRRTGAADCCSPCTCSPSW